MPPRAVIIRNPAARRAVPVERLLGAARRSARSWDVAVLETASATDAADLAERAAFEGADAVLACGGDGTLNGVINGLRRPGCPDVVVGVVPAGTANVWAKEAAIPLDAERALGLLETGRDVRVDLGLAKVRGVPRRFLLMCGVGLDAAVVDAVERSPRLKRSLAQAAFLIAGVRAAWSEQPVIAVVDADGESTRRAIVLAVAGNTRLYGGVTRVTSAAEMDDGLLDLAIFESRTGPRGLLDRASHIARGARHVRGGWHALSTPRFSYTRASTITIRPERAMRLQVDGESAGVCGPDAALHLSVERRAVRLLVPVTPNPLFPRAEATPSEP